MTTKKTEVKELGAKEAPKQAAEPVQEQEATETSPDGSRVNPEGGFKDSGDLEATR